MGRTLLFALVLASGCSKADLSDAALVQGLRVIAVQAEPPEAMPGQMVTLTSWIVDTHGGTIDVSWSACLLPSSGLANSGCTDGSGNGLVALGSGATLTAVVPTVDASMLGPPDASNGVYLPIVVHAAAPDDAIDAVYRLRTRVTAPPGCTLLPPYDPGCAPNNNPAFDSIVPLPDEGTPSMTRPGIDWDLLPRYVGGSSEEYGVPGTSNPDVFETLTTQWFATAGTFPDTPVGGTGVQEFSVNRALPPTGGTIDLWAVGHDERGGTAVAHRVFLLQQSARPLTASKETPWTSSSQAK
jgi:hypothetical protein